MRCVHVENLKTAYPKSDNIMPKSDTVKARMFKHNSCRHEYIQMFMKIYLGCIYTYRHCL